MGLAPLWGLKHRPLSDAVFGLAFGYSVDVYKIFVGSLRKAGFAGDVVLATSKERDMKRGVRSYLEDQRVLSYGFAFHCASMKMGRRLLGTPGGCTLLDWYGPRRRPRATRRRLGLRRYEEGDARRPRPLALARYEMYESWLRSYAPSAYILILDTVSYTHLTLPTIYSV